MAGYVFAGIEIAGMALLRALGFVGSAAVVAGGANELAKKKAESADKAKEAPIAQAGTQEKTKTNCTKCPPDCGSLVTRNWSMSDDAREYQARVTGFAPRTEWNFAGTDFDGFKSAICLLQEAKARYDQFFDPDDGQPKFFFARFGAPKILRQAANHSEVVGSNPPSKCTWHFMQPLSCKYFKGRFVAAAPLVLVILTP